MSSTSGIRIVDLPDIGAVTDDSSVVGEHAGSGRFSAMALRNYITTTGGGPFLPLAGGNLTGTLTTTSTSDILAGGSVYATKELLIGGTAAGFWEWVFSIDATDGFSKMQVYRPGWYDRWDATTGKRAWHGPAGELMGLSNTGELVTLTSITTQYLNATGNIAAGGSLAVGTITSGAYTGTTISCSGNISGANLSATGGLLVNGDVTCSGVHASGDIYATRFHVGGTDYIIQVDGASDNRSIYFSSTWSFSWLAASGNLGYYRNDGVMMFNSIGYLGDFGISGANAFKPGGGSWVAPSDNRIKTITGDYTRGLAEIKALSPKRFIYRGNDTVEQPEAATAAPYKTSPHYLAATNNTEFAGLVAQDIETVMPEMVIKSGGYIDGAPANDIMTVDRSSLDLALVNAIKELEARLVALEAAGPAARRAPGAG